MSIPSHLINPNKLQLMILSLYNNDSEFVIVHQNSNYYSHDIRCYMHVTHSSGRELDVNINKGAGFLNILKLEFNLRVSLGKEDIQFNCSSLRNCPSS